MTIAHTLAEFLAATRYKDIPDQAIDHAAMIIGSTIASAACGRTIPSAAVVRDLTQERGGAADASIWFETGPKLPATGAARVNAMMSDAAASDDSDLRNIVHMGTPLTATSLAIAEKTGADGKAVLSAIVLGYEAAGRIGESITPHYLNQGFHGCLVAIFSATVAASRLLELDAARMTHAIALSATSMGGLHAAANTSVSREYHAGLATMLGIEAAMAAQRGYTGEGAILETDHGFCDVFGNSDGSDIVQGLGESWDIVTDMALKLVPGGHPHHSYAEAAANAAREGDIAPDEVSAIILSRPGVTELKGPRHPANLIDMAHSPSYFLAAAVANKAFGWQHATPAKIEDPIIHSLIDKTRVGPPPTENAEAYRQGATVTIETHDGRSVTNTVLVPRGSGCLGIDWADLDDKYRTLAPNAPLCDAQVEASLAAVHAFREASGADELIGLLRQPTA